MNDKPNKPTFSWGPFKNVPMAGWVVAMASLIGLAVAGVYAYKTSREILQIVPDHLVKFVALEAAKPAEAARHYFEVVGDDFSQREEEDGTVARYHNLDGCYSFLFPGETTPDFMFHPNRRKEIIEKALREGIEVGQARPVAGALFAATAYQATCGDPGPGCCLERHLGDYTLEHTFIRHCQDEDGNQGDVNWVYLTFVDGCKARREANLCTNNLGPHEWLVCVHKPKEVEDEHSHSDD